MLIHHVDLRTAYGPDDWPPAFVRGMLTTVVSAFAGRDGVPALLLTATDTGAAHTLGGGASARAVCGRSASLLAWLLGRSDGADLGPALPRLPFLY